MYEEIMKWSAMVLGIVVIYGGLWSVFCFFFTPYRREIKAVDDRLEEAIVAANKYLAKLREKLESLSRSTADIQGDDWARMAKMDTRLTAEIKAIIDSRIPSVVCEECGCLVADGRQRQKQQVTYSDEDGFPVSPDVIAKRLETGGNYRFIRNVAVFNLCKRCAAEFEKKATVIKKEKSK